VNQCRERNQNFYLQEALQPLSGKNARMGKKTRQAIVRLRESASEKLWLIQKTAEL